MRVLLVADIAGGVRTFTRELVRELAARDVDGHLALIGQGAAEQFERLGARSCEVRDLRLEWMEDPWHDVARTGEWIEELCERHRPDVLHLNTFTPISCREVPVLLTVHSCVLTWWRAVHGCDAPATWEHYRSVARRVLARAELIAVPTHALLDDLIAVHGPLGPTLVIPNGRAISRADASDHREQLVVSVGRIWDEAKNAALLARAAGEIRGRVVSAGPGSADGLESLGTLAERELVAWLSRAAVFAEPARYEPFGLAALEAALCGCALVLGDIPSLREVWGDAARFVSPDDPDALAAAINGLLMDPEARRRAARAARARARTYSPSATAQAYLDSYSRIARTAVAA
jgi:glycosyltransferase involved in cell wall biosynthesis